MPKKKIFSIVVITLILLVIQTTLFAAEENLPIVFQCNGFQHWVTVRPDMTGGMGTTVWLTLGDGSTINLCANHPGQNLGPVVNIAQNNQRFMITWFLYQRGNVQLLAYDSQTGFTRLLPLHDFKTAYPLHVIFKDNEPTTLLFMGNNSNNLDIFYYSLENGHIKNITNTPESDQRWTITQTKKGVLLETSTTHFHYQHRLQEQRWTQKLQSKRLQKRAIEREREWREPLETPEVLPINTVVGFGDSITWGTMRLDVTNPDDDFYHPEWAYLKQLEQIMAKDYGTIATVNLGVPGNYTRDAIERMSRDFQNVNAYFCLIMFGTNDVTGYTFDLDTTIANLDYIINTLLSNYHMVPIISTVPPQKNNLIYDPHFQVHKEITEELNTSIKAMAIRLGIPCVDTYNAFFNGQSYWEDLLEPYKGNHPNPLGHQIIAELFKEHILSPPPATPAHITSTSDNTYSATVQWDINQEFDIGSYHIEFGYTPTTLNRYVNTTNANYRFIAPAHAAPFGKKLYYRIQALDKDGNSSEFSPTYLLEFK